MGVRRKTVYTHVPKLTPQERALIVEMHARGDTRDDIAETIGISRVVVDAVVAGKKPTRVELGR
jgi:DNA-binding NarL/FixJ family response regulator